jgi:hypothetical protein
MDLKDYQTQDIFHLEVDEIAKSTMLEMSRWTKFLAILGFIAIGFMVLGGIVAGMLMANMPGIYGNNFISSIGGVGITIIYLVLAAAEFYPVYALMKYSTNIKVALNTANKQQFNTAIRYLKNMFKYIGIMTIVLFAFYGIAIIFIGIGAATR